MEKGNERGVGKEKGKKEGREGGGKKGKKGSSSKSKEEEELALHPKSSHP